MKAREGIVPAFAKVKASTGGKCFALAQRLDANNLRIGEGHENDDGDGDVTTVTTTYDGAAWTHAQ